MDVLCNIPPPLVWRPLRLSLSKSFDICVSLCFWLSCQTPNRMATLMWPSPRRRAAAWPSRCPPARSGLWDAPEDATRPRKRPPASCWPLTTPASTRVSSRCCVFCSKTMRVNVAKPYSVYLAYISVFFIAECWKAYRLQLETIRLRIFFCSFVKLFKHNIQRCSVTESQRPSDRVVLHAASYAAIWRGGSGEKRKMTRHRI